MSVKKFTYKPNGTCSRLFEFECEDNIIKDVQITGGCDGNLKGICSIIKGKTVEEVISAFNGITCGNKKTSCPDQIAKCLMEEFH
ncbi:TIGR03905 family TSCPD domain-containing protein [Anaerorhabdus sp.]|uniref:TIGR03905 family TSCPD domain-containing protein n=1 Tax=Anaerorhabdus sp. TaxID=1872524 RepID=UPI002FC94074